MTKKNKGKQNAPGSKGSEKGSKRKGSNNMKFSPKIKPSSSTNPDQENSKSTKNPEKLKKSIIGDPSPGETTTEVPSPKDIAENFERVLKRRASKEDVIAAGILKTTSPTKEAKNKEKLSETISSIISSRPDQEEMNKTKEHIINPQGTSRRFSGSLAPTARALERNITSDIIDRHLHNRPEVEDLEKHNVINTHVAPQIQGTQMKLQRQMSSDTLSHMLESRPKVDELVEHGVIHGSGVAAGLQATQEKLQRKLNADQVRQRLEHRPTIEDLTKKCVLDETGMAPRLVAKARKLERHMMQDQVSHLLETRPDVDELVENHIVKGVDVAPSLQGSKQELEKNMTADKISKLLRRRPSKEDLKQRGLISEVPDTDNFGNEKQGRLSNRARYAIALKGAARLSNDGLLTPSEKGKLKDLILSDDKRVIASIECYELDRDAAEMLDTLYRIAKLA